MKTLDRTQAPNFQAFKTVEFPSIHTNKLSSGIPVYFIQSGNFNICEVKVIFDAGLSKQTSAGIANYTSSMLKEGTKSMTALDIAKKLDFFGAEISTKSHVDYAEVTLDTLEKHAEATLPILSEILTQPTFPESEFELLKSRNEQNIKVSMEKTSFGAHRKFAHELFGENHYAGKHLGLEELENITLSKIKDFFQKNYLLGNAKIIVAGNFDEPKFLSLLNKNLGQFPIENNQSESKIHTNASENSGLFIVPKENSQQSTILIGHLGTKRQIDDYYELIVANTIFGAYFGSRLMYNIREEKGYTYGIHSAWQMQKHSGKFVISFDADNQYVADALKEIDKEIERIQTEKVNESELERAKNYIIGSIISNRETPFQHSDVFTTYLTLDLNPQEINLVYEKVQSVTAENVLAVMQKYLNPQKLLKVICGNPQNL